MSLSLEKAVFGVNVKNSGYAPIDCCRDERAGWLVDHEGTSHLHGVSERRPDTIIYLFLNKCQEEQLDVQRLEKRCFTVSIVILNFEQFASPERIGYNMTGVYAMDKVTLKRQVCQLFK